MTVNSDLNGASLQFTLTYISTSGPATTVTWTRESEQITNGTMTVVDNTLTARYTHTLIVIHGLYRCNVAKSPSRDSASLTVQGIIIYIFY